MFRRLLNTALFALALLAAAAAAFAGGPPPPSNLLSGVISSDLTLTLASPGPVYFVLGDLTVLPGVTLTVEPGVAVRMETSDVLATGDYPTKVELDIQGHLIAEAFGPDSIWFVSDGPGSANEWGQIKVESGATAMLHNVSIRSATTGLSVRAGGSASASGLAITKGTVGLSADGVMSVSDLLVTSCVNGVVCQTATGSLRSFRLVSGTFRGIGLTLGPGVSTVPADSTAAVPGDVSGFSIGVSMLAGATISNAIVHDNGAGIEWGSTLPSTVRYCTSVHNIYSVGIVLSAQSSVINSISALNGTCGIENATASYSDVWSNGQICSYGIGPNVVNAYPFFVDLTNGDFHLIPTSPFKSFSNSGGEIGAYGPGAGGPVSAKKSSWGEVKARYR